MSEENITGNDEGAVEEVKATAMSTDEHKFEGKSGSPTLKKYSNEEKLFALLAYVGPLIVLPFLLKSESEFCQFHVRNGIIFLGGAILLAIGGIFPVIGSLFSSGSFIVISAGVLWGGYSIFNEKMDKIPFVSKYIKL